VVCDATGKEGEAGKEGRQGTAPAPSPSLPGSSFHPLLADLLRGNKRDHFEAFGAFDELVRRGCDPVFLLFKLVVLGGAARDERSLQMSSALGWARNVELRFQVVNYYRMLPRDMASTRMAAETIYIPVEGDAAHLGAVAYLAVLAYPSRAEWDKRTQFVEHFKGRLSKLYIDGAVLRKGELLRTYKRPRERVARIQPRYRQMKHEKIEGVLNRAFYRIKAWRLPAAEIALWMMLHNQRVGPFVVKVANASRPQWEPTSIAKACDLVADLLNSQRGVWERFHSDHDFGWDAVRVRHRVWATTKPVLHLAIALRGAPRREHYSIEPLLLIQEPSWLRNALEYAEASRQVLPQLIPSFEPEQAVRLLPEAS